ncbi:MAG: choice-of-anchor D domain-containing protein [Bacteroidetes bacterium]|nr:choice-of-anchor D domain-containing protein [Bacteroidota bacterium]
MCKKFILLFFLLITSSATEAQISGIDASMYPVIRAYGSGTMFNNAKTQDFTVLENGIDMKTTLKTQCNTIPEDPALSAVLVIDRSGSMGDPVGGGKVRLDWVKEGAKTFVNNLDFGANTYVAIISFDGYVYNVIGFQNSRTPLLDAIDNITYASGATQYDPPFLDPKDGAIAMLNTRPAWIRKVIIFLTDGYPNSKASSQKIIPQLNVSKIKTYAICMTYDVAQELRDIAQQSGGQLYVILSLDALNAIYKSLATDRPTITYCWLEWTSPPGCTEVSRTRNVNIYHKPSKLTYNGQYIAPPSSVSGIVNSIVSLPPFPDITVGSSFQELYTITAQNADMQITGATIIPNGNFAVIDWGGTNPPFTLTQGTSRTITVQFTQTAPRDARSAQLLVTGIPCSAPAVLLSGGIKKITLLTPNGGEMFSTCDSLFISWTGVVNTDTVKLEYSLDFGATWMLVTPFATNNFYNWMPPSAGLYKIRVTPYTPKPIGPSWTRSGGGTAGDSSTAITVTADGSMLYMTGDFNKQAGFDGKIITSPRTQEAFLARYNNDKVLWAISGTGFLTQFAPYSYSAGKGVVIDSTDLSCYLIGDIMPNSSSHHELYIAKIQSNNKITWVKSITSTSDVHALRIAKDSATHQIYIEGTFRGTMRIRMATGLTTQFQSKPILGDQLFLAFIDQDGNFTYVQDSSNKTVFNPKIVKDSIGNTYETGTYTGSFVSGDTTVKSAGGRDFYLRQIGRKLGEPDESDSHCTIADPNFRFAYQPITVGVGQIGDFHDTTFTAFLCNKGTIPITITDYKFEGNYPADFSVTSALKGVIIPRDSCISISIRFTPSATSYLSAYLRVYSECSDQQIILTGFGIDRQASIDSLNWFRKRILTDNPKKMWIRNTGTTDVTITKLSLETMPENSFIPILPTIPLIIRAKDSISFLVLFNPQDTITYHNSVLAEIEGFSKPLVGTLDGIGVLPEIRSIGYTFKPTYLNTLSPEIGNCTIFNPSTTSETIVSSIKFIDNPGDFAWVTPPPPNITIQQNSIDIHNFDIRFTAKAIGLRVAHIQITSDAVPGPDATIPKYDTVEITGTGFFTPLAVDSVIDFGALLTCEASQQLIKITNIDPQNPVKITSIQFTGDRNIFYYSPQDSLEVPAGQTAGISIIFSPTENKQYTAVMVITTESNQQFTVLISGSGYTVKGDIQLSTNNPSFNPGQQILITTIATVENLTNTPLDSLTIEITIPPQVLSLSNLNPILTNWSWKIDDSKQLKGIYRIVGKSSQPVYELKSERLFEMQYNTYLEKKGNYPISMTVENHLDCLDLSAKGISVELLPSVCFGDGRVVASTGKYYFLSEPSPNPSVDEISLNFGVALKGRTTISVMNAIGALVKTVEFPILAEGEHRIMIPTFDIPSGIYTIVFSSGQFTEVKQCSIVK